MRGILLALAGAAVVVGIALLSLRLPGVENALYERTVGERFDPARASLFDDSGLKIFFCGTGSAAPSVKRAQSCTGVIFGNRIFLVDVGAGSWERIEAAGISGQRLGGIFLTSLKADHIGDLGEANVGSWTGGRYAPLAVFGPTGVERVVAGFNEAYAVDNDYRLRHFGPGIAPPLTAGLDARPFDPAPTPDGQSPVVFAESGFVARVFPVKKGENELASVGYKFFYKGRTVVISGDTTYTEALVEQARDADLLIHEGQSNAMIASLAAAAKNAGQENLSLILQDMPASHTSPEDAARAATAAGADWLVLTHLAPPPDSDVARRIFLRGVEKFRSKNVRLAEDGLLISLPEAGGIEFSKL
ncbi:MAG: MBL fold metallo-hydrolase [Amphiplicatus sp.]